MLLVLSAAGMLTLLVTSALSAASPISKSEFESAKVHTDGHFLPGSMETIRVSGFPGAGRAEVSFFPSAICEGECGAVTRFGGHIDNDGAGRLHVRVPGYFFNAEEHRTYFRNLERIELRVLWTGRNEDEFVVGYPKRKPVIRRSHH